MIMCVCVQGDTRNVTKELEQEDDGVCGIHAMGLPVAEL